MLTLEHTVIFEQQKLHPNSEPVFLRLSIQKQILKYIELFSYFPYRVYVR